MFVGRDKVYEMTGAQEDLWKEANIKVSDVGIYPVSGLFIFKVKCLNESFNIEETCIDMIYLTVDTLPRSVKVFWQIFYGVSMTTGESP